MPGGPPADPILYSFPSTAELVDALALFIIKAQNESIDKKGRFTLAISGGTLPHQLNSLIGRTQVKWNYW